MNEYIAGFLGGTLSLLVGHPFDTIKALMQARNYPSMFKSAEIIYRQSKFKGFYRGLALPFVLNGPINSLLFGIYGNSLKLLGEATLTNVFIAGVIAGTISTIPANPFELIKTQLQTNDEREIHGIFHCISRIIRIEGYRGFFRGFYVLLLRDSFSHGVYFWVFEVARQLLRELDVMHAFGVDFLAGGLAGVLSWISILPVDIIKNRMQADIDPSNTLMQALKWMSRQGFRGQFVGLTPLLVRGFLVNAVTFVVYVQVLNALNEYQMIVQSPQDIEAL